MIAGPVMGEVRAHNLFQGASITVVGWYGCGRSCPITYFTEAGLLWLASTVMHEIGWHNIFHGSTLLLLAGKVMSEIGAHNMFHGATITVVGWYDCGLVRGP